MNDDERFTRLARLDPAAVADANKRLRVMSPDIRPVRDGAQLLGRARTVRCSEDFLAVIEALAEAQPGDVLVVDTGGSRAAVVGELFSIEAARRGLAGIVIDGGCRDTTTIKTLEMPVYATHSLPVSGSVSKLGEIGCPIDCGGVTVYPGEVLFGDDDGIVVLSDSELDEILPVAETIKRKETEVLRRMRGGESLLEMINLREHLDALRGGDTGSALRFLVD